MALTPLGKALRKLRIDRDILLKDMADGINVAPTYLSAVESGRKATPGDLAERVADWLNLGSEERNGLIHAAQISAKSARIALRPSTSAFDRSLAIQLARNFDALNDQQKNEIKRILDRRKNG